MKNVDTSWIDDGFVSKNENILLNRKRKSI